MSKNILLDAPNVGRLEKKYVCDAIDRGFVSTVGPFVEEFEEKFARFLGVKKAVSTQSGTAAIHIALRELGIRKGHEVIVPALTFVATVNPVTYVGAKPVFADVDIDTWNIDPAHVEKKITKRTRAIIPVHLYGNPCDMDKISSLARMYGLHVIEDAAESLGATYRDKYLGTFGEFGCYSFNGNKIITTGGGGVVAGNDVARLTHMKFLANQARDESGEYFHSEIGFNERMTNIEAALGLAQLKRLREFLKKKRTFNRIYRKELNEIPAIRFQEEYPHARSACWLSCIMFKKKTDIASLQSALRKKGVHTRRAFMPIVALPPYRSTTHRKYLNSKRIYETGLCLPSSTLNSEDDIYYVCALLKKALR